MRRGMAAACMGIVFSLAYPGVGAATVTVGSNLGRAIDLEQDCGASSCTVVQTALPSSSQMPGGIVSPVNGTVTTWRIRAGMDTSATALKTVRVSTSGRYSGVGTSATVIPPANAITAFPAQVPIGIGHLIGLQAPGAPVDYYVNGGGTMATFQPVLLDGLGGSQVPNSISSREIALNVDIEPTSTLKVESFRKVNKGRVSVTVTVPNPGTVVGGDARDRSVPGAAAPAARRGGRLLKQAGKQAAVPGLYLLVMKPTRAARQRLRAGKRPKALVKLSFTPTGGSPTTVIRPVRLKR